MWAAVSAPPSHGSLLHSGGSATAGSISRGRPRLLAAPERLVAPFLLGGVCVKLSRVPGELGEY